MFINLYWFSFKIFNGLRLFMKIKSAVVIVVTAVIRWKCFSSYALRKERGRTETVETKE
jgi:hypothetical protein